MLEDKWHYRLDNNKIRLHLNMPDNKEVVSDCYLLEVILDNLFSYAVKCGGAGKYIHVEWNELARSLCIFYNGYDMPAHYLPLLSAYCNQPDNPGLPRIGLDIAIVLKIATLIQMYMCIKSTEGKGSSFTLYFNA